MLTGGAAEMLVFSKKPRVVLFKFPATKGFSISVEGPPSLQDVILWLDLFTKNKLFQSINFAALLTQPLACSFLLNPFQTNLLDEQIINE
jgi:hypothetical protein